MYISETIQDPYTNCEDGKCCHDLSDGVKVEDLLDHDGPNSPVPLAPTHPVDLSNRT